MNGDILFVKIKSRLGLIVPPNGETELNIGVEEGPDYILSEDFVGRFSQREEIVEQFTSPEDIEVGNYFEILAREYGSLSAKITKKLTLDKTLVSIGGDHSVAFVSIASILRLYDPQTTGIVMIDSHGDLHQPSTSPTGNFHGMWLRPFMDKFEVPSIDKLIPEKVPPKNLIYIGNLDLEIEEQRFLSENSIQVFDKTHLPQENTVNMLKGFVNDKKHIHLSIDVDAFDHSYAPATGMYIENGLTPSEAFEVLDILKQSHSVSVDLVELNPRLEGREQTVELAREIITRVLETTQS